MSRPTIALLTDFGTQDHYVAAMKGVMLGICPDATFVDITHDIPPQDVLAGAWELAACYRDFPAGTVFLVVVDPGVGSSRRGIAVAAGDFLFVAPDNGALTMVLRDSPAYQAVELTERRYARRTVSRTFEGRDRFAPAAAWLARGIALTDLGARVADLQLLDLPPPRRDSRSISGEVVRVDRFGNLITNIDRETFDRFAETGAVAVHIESHGIGCVVTTYAEAPNHALCALFGSSDHLEIAVNGGSAAEALGLARGARVAVERV